MKHWGLRDTAVGIDLRGDRLIAVSVTVSGVFRETYRCERLFEHSAEEDLKVVFDRLTEQIPPSIPVIPVVSGTFHVTARKPLPELPFSPETLIGCPVERRRRFGTGGGEISEEFISDREAGSIMDLLNEPAIRCPGVIMPGRALATGFGVFSEEPGAAVLVDRIQDKFRIVFLDGDRLLYAETIRRPLSGLVPEIRVLLPEVRRRYPAWNPLFIHAVDPEVLRLSSDDLPPFRPWPSGNLSGEALAAAGAAAAYLSRHQKILCLPDSRRIKPVRLIPQPLTIFLSAVFLLCCAMMLNLGADLYARHVLAEKMTAAKPISPPFSTTILRDIATGEGTLGFQPYETTRFLSNLDSVCSQSPVIVDTFSRDGFQVSIQGFSDTLKTISRFSDSLKDRFPGWEIDIRRSERMTDGRFSFRITMEPRSRGGAS